LTFALNVSAAVSKEKQKKGLKILPLITFYNGVKGDVYNWWAENESADEMSLVSRRVLGDLGAKAQGLCLYRRDLEKLPVPELYKKTALTSEEMVDLAKKFGAEIAVAGAFSFTKSPLRETDYRLKVHLEAFDGPEGERIGEIIRYVDLSSNEYGNAWMIPSPQIAGVFSEFHKQLTENRSKIPARQMRLLVSGALNRDQVEALKEKLKTSVEGLNGLQEAVFEPEQVAFNVAYEGKSADFSKALSQVQFPQFMTQVVSSDTNQVLFDVKARAK